MLNVLTLNPRYLREYKNNIL